MSAVTPLEFGPAERACALALVRLGLREDLADTGCLTCDALIAPENRAEVHIVARSEGVVAGLPIGPIVFGELDHRIAWVTDVADGSRVVPNQVIARVVGPLSSILIGERTILNFLTHLSGIATLTSRYVDLVKGYPAVILDTRKTLPGWRALAKYSVRAGGGTNHRIGLYDAVLIKDNHIAAWSQQIGNSSLAAAVKQARSKTPKPITIEVEVDTISQLHDAVEGNPDIVLLDNMNLDQLRHAVDFRNKFAPRVLLEASGGVSLATVRDIAATGVDRISIGALTHSAPSLDLAFDFFQVDSN